MVKTLLEDLAKEYECDPVDLLKNLLDLNGIDKLVRVTSIKEMRELLTSKSSIGKKVNEKSIVFDILRQVNKMSEGFH